MIKVGKIYKSKSGERFLILARKNRPASNGADYIGENTRSGLVTYFKHNGEHLVSSDWSLQVDTYKWCPVTTANQLGQFQTKEEIKLDPEHTYIGYLRMESDNPNTITFLTQRDFEVTYA